MNLQCSPPTIPLKIFVMNSLLPSSQLLVSKILCGSIFPEDQRIYLILHIRINEILEAEAFKIQLENCAFRSTYHIEITFNLPRLTNADVFCVMTTFSNQIDLDNIYNEEEHNNALQSLITVANNLNNTPIITDEKTIQELGDKRVEKDNRTQPIFVTDSLISMYILYHCSDNIPANSFFCSTPLENIARAVLGDYLKTNCTSINDMLIWAANDETFHIEVLKPVILNDISEDTKCDREVIGKHLLDALDMDHTQFSASWLKKDFIEKVKYLSLKNKYGPIYKASACASILRTIWSARMNKQHGGEIYANIGVISDGSYDTVKGCPYILPLKLYGHSWSINKMYESDYHVQQDIIIINNIVKGSVDKMKSYYKEFMDKEDTSTIITDNSSTFSSNS